MFHNFPPYPADRYSEYESDKRYFAQVIRGLKHWHKHHEDAMLGRPTVPDDANSTPATRQVKQFFDDKYNPKEYRQDRIFECDHFTEAATLVSQIVQTQGVEGLYSFFRAMSHEDDGSGIRQVDENRFKDIIRDVFVKHFETFPAEEAVHGGATVLHLLLSILHPLHATAAAPSALKYRSLRNRRLGRREDPPLEVLDNMLPLLTSMHTIAQHALDVLNVIEPIPDRPFPELAPIDTKYIRDAIDRARDARDSEERFGHDPAFR